MANRPPKPPLGLAQAALIMEALGAAAVAHSTSMVASTSSELIPEPAGYPPPVLGLLQAAPPRVAPGFSCEKLPTLYLPRPKVLRKTAQSLVELQGLPGVLPALLVELQFH